MKTKTKPQPATVWNLLTDIQRRLLSYLAQRNIWVTPQSAKRELNLTSLPQASMRLLEAQGLAEIDTDGMGPLWRATKEGRELAGEMAGGAA